MVIPKINSAHGSDTRNILNRAIDSINVHGKSIQDLVAEGQLTPTQYAQLIQSVNGLVKSGQIDKSDLSLNLKTELDEFDSQLAEKANESEVRKKGVPIGLNDAGEDILLALQNKEGETTFNIESIPRNNSVSGFKTDFLELDKSLNLYDGDFSKKTILHGVGNFQIDNLEDGRVAIVEIKPNTNYSVIRQPSSRFKISTDTIFNRTSGVLDGAVGRVFASGGTDYSYNFTTGANDVVLYVDYSSTAENIVIQIVEGEQTELTISDYIFKPTQKLPVYTKKEIDNKIYKPSNIDFLENPNLFSGEFIRYSMPGGVDSFTIQANPDARTARVPIKPNTTYSVIREPSSLFKIGTDTVSSRLSGAIQGDIQIMHLGASGVYHDTFTTGPNDVVLYVYYTNADEDTYVEVLEGVHSEFISDGYGSHIPNEKISVYSKKEIDTMISKKGNPLKLLMIGNSFSIDAATFLVDVAKSVDVDLTIGVVHGSGHSLQRHWEKIQNNEPIDRYEKYTQSGIAETPNVTLLTGVKDEDWDIITFQQASSLSGDYASFQPYLNNIFDYVRNNATNPNVRYGLHMTWAYADGHASYGTQAEMYESIVSAYKQAMEEMDFDILLPTGTAIQNARTNTLLNSIGDKLTSDGAHLEQGIGRYIAGLTVYGFLLTSHFSDVKFVPGTASKYQTYLAKLAVTNAVLNPFKVSNID